MNLSRYEQETIILFDEEEKTATVNTCNYKLKKKLKKISEEYDSFKLIREDEYSVTYEIPKRYVTINTPRNPTEEQRIAASERMKEIQRNKFSSKDV